MFGTNYIFTNKVPDGVDFLLSYLSQTASAKKRGEPNRLFCKLQLSYFQICGLLEQNLAEKRDELLIYSCKRLVNYFKIPNRLILLAKLSVNISDPFEFKCIAL